MPTKSRWNYFRDKITRGENPQNSGLKHKIIKTFLGDKYYDRIIEKWYKYSTINQLNVDGITNSDLELLFIDDINSNDSISKITKLKYEIIFTAGYPQIFSDRLIRSATCGAFGSHPSLLPKYRGAHPLFWVLFNLLARSFVGGRYV